MKNPFLLLLLALLIQSCAPRKAFTVEGAFHPGQQLKYRLTETGKMDFDTTTMPGGLSLPGRHQTLLRITELTYTVGAVTPEGAELDMVVSRIYEKETAGAEESVYDSDLAPAGVVRPDTVPWNAKTLEYYATIGRPLHLNLSPKGQVLSANGTEAAWAAVIARFDTLSTEQTALVEAARLRFNDSTLLAEQSTRWDIGLKKKVRVGQKWKKPFHMDKFHLDGTTIYRLTERNAGKALVGSSTKFVSDAHAAEPADDQESFLMRFALKGASTGRMVVNQPGVLILQKEDTLNMTGFLGIKFSFLKDWIDVPARFSMHYKYERVN